MINSVKNPPAVLESTARVRFQDCDPFGHLNNARYIDYFMNARQDQVAEIYGLQLFEKDKQPAESWVVSKTQIAYLAPARLAEEVLIRTCLVNATETGLVVEGVMMDAVARHFKAVAWIEFTYISLITGRKAEHSEDLMRLFRQVEIPGLYQEDSFNKRVGDLRIENRSRRFNLQTSAV